MRKPNKIATFVAVVLGVGALNVSESQSVARTAEVAGVQPCESECAVNYWTGNQTYYCYPGGEWECPLYKKEEVELGGAR